MPQCRAFAATIFASTTPKILQGTKPGDIPIEQPTRFELVINRKAAANVGITIPTPLLVQANEVVD